uniref:Uncharacterized protein n=1 Tax=Arundo donax TaxID=35708 RepID=A0A0A8XZG2_ARUDO
MFCSLQDCNIQNISKHH